MAQINWQQARQRPVNTLSAFVAISWKVSGYTLRRLATCLSPLPQPSLRTAIGNIVCATLSAWDSDIVLNAPKAAVEKARKISTPEFTAFDVGEPGPFRDADVVIVYLHGGGYCIGHPLQYRTMYKRWLGLARKQGMKLAIVAVQYPLAPKHPYPSQLETVLAVYRHLIHTEHVTPEKICFAGDSAGGISPFPFGSVPHETRRLNRTGNLVAATVLAIRDDEKLPSPGKAVLFSAWLDLTLSTIENHECLDRDVLVIPAYMKAHLVPAFIGKDYSPSDPRISPVLATDFKNLPAQLVVYGDLEVMQDEAKTWIQKSTDAGVPTTVYIGKGGLHGFGVGGLLCDSTLRREVDDTLFRFLKGEKD
ncbi:hypothetical protein AYO21_11696 [Fonsecaea monophora]|uniref:Alpha/beta hydrolase fold-3 domain-containing protein n=1 Tax=Fonsecaea monophora TaxID=254056 RepID=A0A177EQ90_9EURO|nr:hypothetical protein AYO21_11696 [Fonsecaea monophora]OAG34164.1 hypothetical protein AYO21_11696 [Fonsecaea monophora]